MTIVITPLISLMQDQCFNLQAVGIRAETINGETPAAVATSMLKGVIAGHTVGGEKSKAASKGKGKGKGREESIEIEEVVDSREIKLIYVSPFVPPCWIQLCCPAGFSCVALLDSADVSPIVYTREIG